MGFFDSLFNPGKSYQKAQETLDRYYNEAQGFQKPYNQFGKEAYAQLSPILQQLLNPEELQNKWAMGYEESPYATMLEDEAQNQGLQAASQMGLMGSTPALQAIQAGRSKIGAADRQQYLNDLMQKLQLGTNVGMNIYDRGASSASQMGQNAMNAGQTASGLSYGEQAAPGAMFGNLLGGLTTFGTPIAQAWGMNKLGLNNAPWQQGWNTRGSYGS